MRVKQSLEWEAIAWDVHIQWESKFSNSQRIEAGSW